MLKILRVVFASLVATSLCAPAASYDVRNVYWGMTMDQVQASESAKPELPVPHILLYKHVQVAGVDTWISYEFIDNKLASVMYWPYPSGKDTKESVEDGIIWAKRLAEKYGPSSQKIDYPKGKQNVTGKRLFDLLNGNEESTFYWTTERTIIELRIFGLDELIQTSLRYNDITAVKALNARRAAERNKEF